jgi:hypothetical protein
MERFNLACDEKEEILERASGGNRAKHSVLHLGQLFGVPTLGDVFDRPDDPDDRAGGVAEQRLAGTHPDLTA